MLKRKSGETVRVFDRLGRQSAVVSVARVYPGVRAKLRLTSPLDPRVSREVDMAPGDEFSFVVLTDVVRVVMNRIEGNAMTLGFDAPYEVKFIRPGWRGEQAALAAAG